MLKKKIIIGLFLLYFLNGCVQSTGLLGPAYTLVNTGNIYQAGLSYGSSQAVKKMTGKTLTENIKSFVEKENTTIEKKEENRKKFIALAENNIAKASKVLNLASQ